MVDCNNPVDAYCTYRTVSLFRYLVTDSFEQCLSPSDVIEDLKQTLDARPFLLAYKRHEARLAWPSLSGLITN